MARIVIPKSEIVEVELPPTGKRKTGDVVKLTTEVADASEIIADGVLTDALTVEMATRLLFACLLNADDADAIDALDDLAKVGTANALRQMILTRNMKIMVSTAGSDSGND